MPSFGQSHREFLADIDPKLEPNLVQTLHMINAPYINDKVRGGTTVDEAMKGAKDDDEMLHRLFVRVVGREPTSIERSKAFGVLAESKDKRDAVQDILWALVTSREFHFNH